MLIDFHTHAFPDAIAAKTIKILEEKTDSTVLAHTDGTVKGLLGSMEKSKVDISVVCPIATKVSQTNTINTFAKTLRDGKLISFGSLHPDDPDAEGVLGRLCENGFRGIKLHPEYQQFFIDSPEAVKIINKARELSLTVVVHAGKDPAYTGEVHCSPERVKNLLNFVNGDNIVLAHLGGMGMWEDVEKYLVGTPVMMDTAAISTAIDRELYREIVLEHGADRILFGSDSPWEDPSDSLAALKALRLPKADFEQITYKNACGLLGVKAVNQ